MTGVFETVLHMSLTGSLVILAVLLLRLLLKKAPKAFSYALWGIVLFRLLCPISLDSSLSLIPEPVADGEIVTKWTDDYVGSVRFIHDIHPDYEAAVGQGREPISAGEEGHYVATAPDGVSAPATIGNTWLPILSRVWLLGMAVMAGYGLISLLRLCRKLQSAMLLRDNIYLADHIDTPFVMGLFRPKIYLPSGLAEGERGYILLHEQHHIRCLDHVAKILAFAALCVHWFNPFVWIAFALSGKDMEMRCDEAVLKKLGEEVRSDYSASLMCLATGRRIISGAPLTFGEGDPKGRIKNMLSWKRPALWVVIAAVMVLLVAGLTLLTNPAEEDGRIMVSGRIYYQTGSNVEMPRGSMEIGRLQGIVKEEPTADFYGAGLKKKYAGLPVYHDPAADTVYLPTSEGFLLFRANPNPFGHTYRVADTVYFHPGMSFAMTPENAPLYSVTADKTLQIKESYEWLTAGTFAEIELTEEIFDDLFLEDGWPTGKSIAQHLREKNVGAWRLRVADASGSAVGETVCYYLIQLPDGTVYLTYGIYDYEGETDPHSDDSEIRWLFLLEQEDGGGNTQTVSVTSGPNRISATQCDSVSDVNILSEQVEYLTIAPDETEGTPFRVFANGEELYGWYSIYDAETGESLEFFHPSGLAPQTYILQNASYGRSYVVTLLADVTGDEMVDLMAFGVTVPNVVDEPGSLDAAVSEAIMEHNRGKYYQGAFACESHTVLEVEEAGDTVTAYVMALYQEYVFVDGKAVPISGGHIPTAITFALLEDDQYALREYWEPRDGSYYPKDLAAKFPPGVDYGSPSLYEAHKADCDAKAAAYFASVPEMRTHEASLDLEIDGDGEADTAFLSVPISPMPEEPAASLSIKLGTGTLLETTIDGAWMGPHLYSGDVNGDGRDELLLSMEVLGSNYGASGVFVHGVENGVLNKLPSPEEAIHANSGLFAGLQSDYERGYGDCLGARIVREGEKVLLRVRMQKEYNPGEGVTTAWYVDMRFEKGAWQIENIQAGEAYGEDKIIE